MNMYIGVNAHHIAITYDGTAKVFGAGLNLETEATAETRDNDVYSFGILLLQLLNNFKPETRDTDNEEIENLTAQRALQLSSLCCKSGGEIPSASSVRIRSRCNLQKSFTV